MATVTASDYRNLRDSCYRNGGGKEELKTLATLPNEAKLLSIFQAAEDRTVAAFALFRADMETALGVAQDAASLALAKKFFAAYCQWKINNI
jgi:hypothetical protein